MTIQEAIQKANEGGWKTTLEPYRSLSEAIALALLDPLFWQALGKSMGWEKKTVVRRGIIIGNFVIPTGQQFEEMGFDMDYIPTWCYHWHRLIDKLAEGGTIEDYFNNL